MKEISLIQENAMYVSVLSLLAGWIIFSTFLVTLILINSARLGRTDNPEIDQDQSTVEHHKKRVDLETLIKMLSQ
jgi:hypothetical protein